MDERADAALGSVVIIGGGNMGGAICAGLVGPAGLESGRVCVVEPSEVKRVRIESDYGVTTVASVADAPESDTAVIAVKPGAVPGVCSEIASAPLSPRLLITIAAGVSTSVVESALPGVPVVRVMPNTPLLVGEGMSCICAGSLAGDSEIAAALGMFSAMGRAVAVEESQMDAVTALSGSGPAYYELVAETLARAAVDEGLSYEVACELAVQTMLGTARLVTESGQSLPDAIEAVSSPGGTTVAALGAMREGGIEEALADGVAAAAKRSAELGESL